MSEKNIDISLIKSKSLQIYMKPGIEQDDLLIAVWESCKKNDRPQDIFRTMLKHGLKVMVESGEIPDSVIDECHLDEIFEKKRSRTLSRLQKKTTIDRIIETSHVDQHIQERMPVLQKMNMNENKENIKPVETPKIIDKNLGTEEIQNKKRMGKLF